MTKTITFAIMALVSSAVVIPTAHAGSAVEAVQRMASEALATNPAGIDPMTTSSLKKPGAYDARGVVLPNAEVTLGAGLAARIEKMPFKVGQRFKKGDTLVAFDCARQQADLRGAKAGLGKVASLLKQKKRLKARGAAGGQEVKDAASDVETARATVDGLSEVIDLCQIDAPFAGRVLERHAETYETPAANAPVLTVVDDSDLELDLIVPSTWLRWVKPGTIFDFAVDELGNTFRARIDRLGAKVDAVSQTIKLTGAFVKRPQNVLAGMSGTAKFTQPGK